MNIVRNCRIVACSMLLLMIGGCVEEREITINTKPTGADAKLSSQEGVEKLGQAPLVHKFRFSTNPSEAPSSYDLTCSAKGFESNTVSIKREDKQTSIFVELKPEPEVVREVNRLEPVISEEKGYTVQLHTARAWVEDIEREGMASSSIVKLGDNQTILGMALSTDGNRIFFAIGETVKDENGAQKTTSNIRAVQTGGGGVIEITSGQWLDNYPTVGVDGALYFGSNRLRPNKVDIFRVSSEQTSAIAVVRQTAEGYNLQPSISRNGVMAFTYKPEYRQGPSFNQIWTLGGENQYPTQIREGSMPSISPDGTQIAYIGSDGQLWKVPVSGQNPVQLTNTPGPGGKRNPSWSYDANYILYASDEAKDGKGEPNYDIWIIREDGMGPRQLTTNGSLDDFPLASPDQKYIYFVSNRGFKEGIWRIPFPHTK